MKHCKSCGAALEDGFCPACGVPVNTKKTRRTKWRAHYGVWGFVRTVLLIALAVLAVCVALDCTAFAHDPKNATAYAVVTSIRNMVPSDVLAAYDTLKAQIATLWADAAAQF